MTSASELFCSRRSRGSDWSYSQHYLSHLDGQRSDRIFGIDSHHRTRGSVTCSESGRLPCTVLQAKERLLRRLRGDDAVPEFSHISISSSNSDFHSESDPMFLAHSKKHYGQSQQAVVCMQNEVFKSTNKSNENNGGSWDCSICLERFSNGNKLTRLPCGHRFHQECIRQWIQIRGDCPCCRSNVF